MTPSTAEDTRPSRRARNRKETFEEIKGLAKKQLAEQGPGALSLRAIAREMGTASSALYRYFARYDDLITALCVDAYESLADALSEASEAEPLDNHARRWWTTCHAYRRWSLEHPADFALLFGTPVPGYQASTEATGPAAARATSVLLQVYAAAVQSGGAHPERTQVPQTLEVGDLLRDLLAQAAPDYPPRLAALAMNAWASVLGFLALEIFGSLPLLVSDTDELFRAHVRTVMLGMGFDLDGIDSA